MSGGGPSRNNKSYVLLKRNPSQIIIAVKLAMENADGAVGA